MPWARLILSLAVAVTTACGTSSTSPCHDLPVLPEEGAPHHDRELEARIPDEIGDGQLDLFSICANATELAGINVAPEFLDELGVGLDDVTYAAHNPRIGDVIDVSFAAFRYYGATAEGITSALRKAVEAVDASLRADVRAGKKIAVGEGMLVGVVFYIEGDTLYQVSGSEEQVDDVLEGLP